MIVESVFNASSVEEYLAFLARRGRKETTLKHFRYTIRKGGEALRKAGVVDPYEIDAEDVIAMEQLLDLKESTRRVVVVTTGCYIGWLTGRNPAHDAAILWNGEAPARKWITPEEYRRMMAKACPWMRLVLALGATMGLRRTEMANLALGDIEDGYLTVHGKGRGKEGKVVTMAMSEAVRKELDAYLKVRRPSESDRLLISCQRKAMNPGSIANAVVKLGRECGVELSMHSLRRLYAMTMADAGIPLETMARMMRHASPEVTMRCYLKADPRRMATAQSAVDAALACRRTSIKYPVAHYEYADRKGWIDAERTVRASQVMRILV
jgi:integrase